MSITQQQLLQILPQARQVAGFFVPALNGAMARFKINSPVRMAAFIAQIGHESGQFQYVRELGGDQYLSKYDTGTLAKRLGNTLAADGDGQKYRGRGLIQITGHDNYLVRNKARFGNDRLLRTPELLEQAKPIVGVFYLCVVHGRVSLMLFLYTAINAGHERDLSRRAVEVWDLFVRQDAGEGTWCVVVVS